MIGILAIFDRLKRRLASMLNVMFVQAVELSADDMASELYSAPLEGVGGDGECFTVVQ